MTTLTTSLRRAPPPILPLLLTLALTACGGPETPAPTPGPDLGPAPADLAAPAPQPLTPAVPPLMTGEGVYQDGMLRRSPSYQSCTSRTPTCAIWYAPLPPARPGYELRVAPVVPLYDLTGASIITVSPDQKLTCGEGAKVQVQISTDQSPAPVDLFGGPISVAPGAARLTVSACAFGVVSARLGTLTGTITFIPTPSP